MDWFSEKFIEDCISEAPSAFLGRPLALVHQQPRILGFVPDLVFEDEIGNFVIVEVQKSALDRHHLYKCLEYRDSLAEEGASVSVVLVCEDIPQRYTRIAETHHVEVICLPRENTIKTAIEHCPTSLSKHLLRSDKHSPALPVAIREDVKPYAWSKYDTLVDVYRFTIAELNRCGIEEKYRNEQHTREILEAVEDVLSQGIGDLVDPVDWNIDHLLARPEGWLPPQEENIQRIRRPRALLRVFITAKRNLSVRWHPFTSDTYNSGECDWVRWPSDQPYAYERPSNELLFLHNIYRINVDPDRLFHVYDGDERAAVNSMLLGLIYALIQHIRSTLSLMLDCQFETEFTLELGDDTAADQWAVRRQILGWRIVDAETLRIEEAQRRVASFEARETAFSVDAVIMSLDSQLPDHSRKLELSSAIAKDMRSNGLSVKSPQIKTLLHDMMRAGDPRLAAYAEKLNDVLAK